VFGQEDSSEDAGCSNGCKRKQTTNTKYFQSFCVNNYKKHLQSQHCLKWTEYQSIKSNAEAVNLFFKLEALFVNKLESHFELEKAQTFVVNKDIVDIIISEMLLDPNNNNKQETKAKHLTIFKQQEEDK